MGSSGGGIPLEPDVEVLVRVSLVLCSSCLAGVGGECHTPGCALWMNRAPDVPIIDKCESSVVLGASGA